MNKRAFTLIEILVAVVLLGLISMFISSTIMQTKKNNVLFKNKTQKDSRLEITTDILYKDIHQSKKLFVEPRKRYSTLHVKTKNSLYGIPEPYVVWLVLKQDDILVRLESAKNISLPIKKEFEKYLFIDVAIKNCTNFSINLSDDKRSVLSFFDIKNSNKVVFETILLH